MQRQFLKNNCWTYLKIEGINIDEKVNVQLDTATYWSGVTKARSPSPTSSENYGSQMSKSKLILAVPYYGYEWPTVDNVRHAKTTGTANTFKYKDMIDRPNIYGRIWDYIWKTPWYAYQADSQWNEGH